MDQPITIDTLITLGAEVIGYAQAENRSIDDLIASLETYYTTFAEWEENRSGDEEHKALERLKGVHTEVVSVAENLLADTTSDMRAFQKRVKGLRSYTDTGPKRVSIFRGQKG